MKMFVFAAMAMMVVSSAKAALPDPNLIVNTQSRQTALNNGSALGGGCPLTKAPGSNFSYGEFLHVSPSPQPRMRTFSHTQTSGDGDSGRQHEMPFVGVISDTPTSGTRARARFLDYGHGGAYVDQEHGDFVVGPLTTTTTQASAVKGSGVGLVAAFGREVLLTLPMVSWTTPFALS